MRGRPVIARITSMLRRRAALGVRPAVVPVMVFVPLGVLLGPAGMGLLNVRVLSVLDVVISIALATLAVFVGIAAGNERSAVRRLVHASAAEGMVTMLLVAGACLALVNAWGMPLQVSDVIAAGTLGVAAAASAAPALSETDDQPRQIAARVADLDDVLPILLGALVVSLAAPGSERIALDLVITVAAGAGVAVGGWLLFDQAQGVERGVFVIGTLALLGGCAAYLHTSPLLTGFIAGFLWARMPGRTDRIVAEDLRKVQHPFVVLLLIAAGVALQPSPAGIWLVAPFVLFRTAGKLLGGWVASRLAPGVAPADLGAYLLTPGVLGVAFTLNLQQIVDEAAAPLVFAAVVGAVTSEFLALLVAPEAGAQLNA